MWAPDGALVKRTLVTYVLFSFGAKNQNTVDAMATAKKVNTTV